MTDKDRNEALDHQIDRLLEGAAGQSEGEPRDPLLDLASALHGTLQQPARPSSEFRARLKAELLERYADNVRPFPAAVRTTVTPPLDGPAQQRVRHIRHAVVAIAVATAAAIALLVGYNNMRDHLTAPPSVALKQDSPTHTPTPFVPSPTPIVPSPAPRAHNTPVTVKGGDTSNPSRPNQPIGPGPRPGRPSPTPHSSVAQNVNPTPITNANLPTPPVAPTTSGTHGHGPTGNRRPTATVRPHSGAGLPATATTTATPIGGSPQVAERGPDTATPTPNSPPPTSTATPVPSATNTVAVPTSSATPVPPSSTPSTGHQIVDTSVATATPVPTRAVSRATATHTTAPAAARTVQPRIPPSPTRVPPRPTATHVPVVIHPAATQTVAHPTATHTVAHPTATRVPAIATATTKPAASPTRSKETSVAPTATPTAVSTPTNPPTATVPPPESPTPVPAPPTSTPAPAATDTTVPASTPTPQNTQAPATATEPPLVALNPSATPGNSVSASGKLPTPTISGPTFPLPSAANAPAESPISATVPLTPGIELHLAGPSPSDPGALPVLAPVLHQISARQQLRSYRLTAQKISGPTDSLDSITSTVTVDRQQYRAVLRAQSYGYRLTLKLLATGTQSTPTQGATFEALHDARTFLQAHALDNNLQEDAVDVGNGVTTVTFGSYLSHVYKVMGAGAVLTFTNSGTLVSADVHVVDDSTAFVTNGISVDTALNEVAGGYGLIASEGNVVPDQTASITGTAIIYVPVSSQGTSYLEPMYQFSGITGNGLRFEVYVPAIDQAYLR